MRKLQLYLRAPGWWLYSGWNEAWLLSLLCEVVAQAMGVDFKLLAEFSLRAAAGAILLADIFPFISARTVARHCSSLCSSVSNEQRKADLNQAEENAFAESLTTLPRKESLLQFLFHADIPLSNNHVERAIRPVAVGRKNWLFCWTEVGAKYAAIAFTLIECCKLHGINPWEYLVDVLQRIDTHPARQVHLLTPKHWKENFADKARTP